jgi:sterol desaturase/sphingolipid hydroxylase (fatty acid hydroxylase superfamily)
VLLSLAHALRGLLSRQLYPLLVGGSLGVFLYARSRGWALEPVVLASGVASLALVLLLERWMPHRADWRRAPSNEPDDLRTDATSAAVLLAVVDPLLKAALPVLAVVGLQALPAWAPLFPQQAPFAVQVLLALLWSELARYAVHRWHHERPALWWLHAMHHGSTRLYWLNGLRFHPLNYAFNTVAALGPLWLLGAPAEVLLAVAAITQPVQLVQHANVALRSGVWNRVFSTTEVHRWHHSARPAEANANYGSALVLWDQVFGTYLAPQAQGPQRIGLFGASSAYPATAGYWRQLLSFLRPPCCRITCCA